MLHFPCHFRKGMLQGTLPSKARKWCRLSLRWAWRLPRVKMC